MNDIFGLKRYFRAKRIKVLMYHRITNLQVDPWQNAVSPENFEEQLQVLKKYTVVSVDRLVEQIKKGRIVSDQVCITFDDGYVDNYENAKPLLEKYECPATFFIPSDYILQQQPYWWDDLQYIILEKSKLPPSFSVTIDTEVLSYTLDNQGILTEEEAEKHRRWCWPAPPPTQRAALYMAIWERLRPLPYHAILSVLELLRQIADVEKMECTSRLPMHPGQLKNIADEPLFNVGLHTATHSHLFSHSIDIQRDEISKNKVVLQQICERPIDTIAYPYGAYNNDTLSVVSDLQLKAAFTTKSRLITHESPLHALGRHQALNVSGEVFEKWLYLFRTH